MGIDAFCRLFKSPFMNKPSECQTVSIQIRPFNDGPDLGPNCLYVSGYPQAILAGKNCKHVKLINLAEFAASFAVCYQ